MSISKTLSTAGVGAAVIVGSMLAVNAASAHYGNGNGGAELADRLATELNLDSSEVQGVLNSMREERQAERQAEHTERLTGFVEDGTLTQEQADALTVKAEERQAERDTLREQDLTRDEMHEQMEASREEFETWADDQGIDLDVIRPEQGPNGPGEGGHRSGPQGGFGR